MSEAHESEWFYATIKTDDEKLAVRYATLRNEPTDPPEPAGICHTYGTWKLSVGARVLVQRVVFDLTHWKGQPNEWVEKNHVVYRILFYGKHMHACSMNESAAKIFLESVRRGGKPVACTERDAKWAKAQMDKIWWELSR